MSASCTLDRLADDCPLTSIARNIAVQATEDDIDFSCKLFRRAVLDDQLSQLFVEGTSLLPLHGIFVLLASTSGRCAHCCELEMRMLVEEKDEPLAHGASGTKDA